MMKKMPFLAAAFGLAAFVAPANAQTPGQYCATVSGCEILDLVTTSDPYANNTADLGAGILKYCKNGKLNMVIANFYGGGSSYDTISVKGAPTLSRTQTDQSNYDPLNDDDCANLP